MAGELDPGPGQPHSASMSFVFDTLAAADALRDAGMEPAQARAVATQLRAAAGAGDAVTRPELEAALAKLKTELVERMTEGEGALRTHLAESVQSLRERITEGEEALRAQMAKGLQSLRAEMGEGDQSLREQLAETDQSLKKGMAENDQSLRERIAEGERTLLDRIAEYDQSLRERIAERERMLLDRIAESERRHAALLWRLFGGIVATAGVAVAAARFLPAGSVLG